jgi:hypothetical protein
MRPRPALAVLIALLALPAGAHAKKPAKAPRHVDTPSEIRVDLAAQVRRSRLNGVRTVSPATTQTYLPVAWCGIERTTDDTAHSTLSAGQPFYKLVYAYASGEPDRFAAWQDVLQADVSLIGQYMALQDGATKAPRFDMGTSCGPDYVDIQVVQLPGARSTYVDDFDAIRSAVEAQLGASSSPRNVVVLADGLTANAPGYLYGLGESYNADFPGSSNPHAGGGLYAMLFPTHGYDPTVAPGDQFYPGFWAEGMLHEITHTLGAVFGSAPHSTGNGHCTDGSDVMCYDDGGPNAGGYSSAVCPALTGAQAGMTQTYDCGRDDYFNPSPDAGSYLATHWNVWDNPFLAACPTIGDACGSEGATVPVNIDPPRTFGAAQAGVTLTADPGTWSGTPDAYAYQWQRTPIGGGDPVDVAGATGTSYALGSSDVGRRIRLVVVASNASGDSVPAASSQSALVAVATPPSTPTTTPTDPTPSSSGADPITVPTQPADVYRTATVSLKRGRRTTLKLLVTSRVTRLGIVATVPSKRVKVTRRGTYRLTLCVGSVCITKPFRARHGRAKLPNIVASSVIVGPVTLRLIGPGGLATGAL